MTAGSGRGDSDVESLIDRYRNGVQLVERALEGASDSDLDLAVPGEWSSRMVAHHLADSETNSYVRLRRLLAEEPPVSISGYDEAAWAMTPTLGYRDTAIDESLAVFRAVRAASLSVLHRLEPRDLERTGVHSESGNYSVRDWLEIYAAHAEDHARQIERARAKGEAMSQQSTGGRT